jgi:hypothetical protein
MIRISILIILSVICFNRAQANLSVLPNPKNVGDTTILPSKDEILSALISLRDSIDNSVIATQAQREQNKTNYVQQFDNAYAQLTSQRREVEKVIEEIVTSNSQTWDQNIRTRATSELSMRRRDYNQTVETLDKIIGSENKSKK